MKKVYPVVRCTDPAARLKLAEALAEVGIRHYMGIGGITASESPYMSIIGNVVIMARDSDIKTLSFLGHWGQPMTLVNSPAHMLSYLKRTGLTR